MLKDITLGQFFPGDTLAHKLDPRTKLLVTVFYVVALFTAKSYIAYGVLILTLIVAVRISRVGAKALFKGLKPVLFIIAFTALLNLFYTPGTELCHFWIFRITIEGVRAAITMMLRITLLIMGTFLLTYTTSPIRLTDSLSIQDYYRTDTHWRQERLLPAAQALCQALGASSPRQEDYTVTPLEKPFYGVYYGQAALPMQPDTMYLLKSDLLDDCRVYDYETGETAAVYDMTKLSSKDLYDVYLSGARSLLTIENPNAATDRELIVFRDSFGSSIVPLLVNDYAKVTLVDLRYIRSDYLGQFLDFHGQDVLFLYSTLLLNNSAAIK